MGEYLHLFSMAASLMVCWLLWRGQRGDNRFMRLASQSTKDWLHLAEKVVELSRQAKESDVRISELSHEITKLDEEPKSGLRRAFMAVAERAAADVSLVKERLDEMGDAGAPRAVPGKSNAQLLQEMHERLRHMQVRQIDTEQKVSAYIQRVDGLQDRLDALGLTDE